METNKINLDNKFFRFNFRYNVLSSVMVNTIGLLIFFAVLFYTFYYFYSSFEKDYKLTMSSNFNREISSINNSQTNIIFKKNEMKKVVNAYLENKNISSIWISDSKGLVIIHSSEKEKIQHPDISKNNQYNPVFQHNWTFSPDGKPILLIINKAINDYSEVFYPVYNIYKKIDYITGMKYDKYLSKIVYIPALKIYINIFYVIIISLAVLLISISVCLITVFSIKKYNRNMKKCHDLLTKLYEFDPEKLPFEFEFQVDDKKYNFMGDFVKYVNHLFDQFSTYCNIQNVNQDKIKKIITPSIFKSDLNKDRIKITVKPDDINLKQFLWEFYFKDHDIKAIQNYSTGVYHYYKKNNTDVIFKYIDISDTKKGFFIGHIVESDVGKKTLLLSLIHFILQNYKADLENTGKYFAAINNIINHIGRSELQLNASYIVLNNDTDYIEISSTNFSPVIHYKSETDETSFYEFSSLPLGAKQNDDFLKKLSKESFKLSDEDIIFIPNENIEKMTNVDNRKFEIYKISDVIKKYKELSVDVILDKVKNEFHSFSVDFSKLNDLFILGIKKTRKINIDE